MSLTTHSPLVNELNTIGAFNRARADRAIVHASAETLVERQQLHIERDLANLDWLFEACEEAAEDIPGGSARRLEARRGVVGEKLTTARLSSPKSETPRTPRKDKRISPRRHHDTMKR